MTFCVANEAFPLVAMQVEQHRHQPVSGRAVTLDMLRCQPGLVVHGFLHNGIHQGIFGSVEAVQRGVAHAQGACNISHVGFAFAKPTDLHLRAFENGSG